MFLYTTDIRLEPYSPPYETVSPRYAGVSYSGLTVYYHVANTVSPPLANDYKNSPEGGAPFHMLDILLLLTRCFLFVDG